MYITLKEARKHLNIDDYFTEDDALIVEMIRMAEDATEKRLNRPLCSLASNNYGVLPGAVKASILLMVGSLYNNREGTTSGNVKETPLAYEYLTNLDRKTPIG